MKIGIKHIIGIFVGLVTILVSFLFLYPTDHFFFKPGIALGIAIAVLPFWIEFLRENARQKEIEQKFLEFVRAITGNVKSGTPLPKAVKEAAQSNYGALTPYVRKMGYQMDWGIPFKEALQHFSKSTNNKIIRRAVAIIIEAEKSGGNIQDVMDGVTTSVVQIKKIKDERRAATFTQIIQGYIVFFIFIAIMIILQIFLLPQLADISGDVFKGVTYGTDVSGMIESGDAMQEEARAIAINFENLFIFLILIQGLFAGLMIGDFAEGSIKFGVQHAFILMLVGYMAFTIATGLA